MNKIDYTNIFNVSKLRCPACLNEKLTPFEAAFFCGVCNRNYSAKDGVLDLRLDPSYDTQLDIHSYDEAHGVNKESSKKLYNIYKEILSSHGANTNGAVLEIASGSGYLTQGITNLSSFSEIHCSDLSPGFMKQLRGKLGGGKTGRKNLFYLFDANRLPFIDQSFDVVLGNSVLHHFANFENTLIDCYRVLKSGGAAVFGEPVLDIHVFVSLSASLIRAFDSRQLSRRLSKHTDQVLAIIENRATLKRNNLRSDRSDLDSIEDKFQFPIEYMRDLSTKIGYSLFECRSNASNLNFGKMIKSVISRVFIQSNADITEIEEYDYIFDSLSLTYGEAMKEDLKALFSFFIFIK